MCSYLKCPSVLESLFLLFLIALIVSVFVFLRTKKINLSVLVFSFLGSSILFFEAINNALWFQIYSVEWLQYSSLFIFPVINIILIVLYVRKKKQ